MDLAAGRVHYSKELNVAEFSSMSFQKFCVLLLAHRHVQRFESIRRL